MSIQRPRAGIPPQGSVIVAIGPQCFRPFIRSHRFPKPLVGVVSGTRRAQVQPCFWARRSANDPRVIEALVFAVKLSRAFRGRGSHGRRAALTKRSVSDKAEPRALVGSPVPLFSTSRQMLSASGSFRSRYRTALSSTAGDALLSKGPRGSRLGSLPHSKSSSFRPPGAKASSGS